MKTSFTKSLYIAAIFSVSTFGAFAQKEKANVGIGTTQPDESAVLDIKSSTKGLLIPRMSLQQRGQIQNPANGLMVYQTDMLSGFYFYDGKEWKPLTSETSANSVAADPNDWRLAGNGVAPGAATAASFIGTPAGIPINFKIGGVTAGAFSSGSNFYLGYQANLAGGTGTNNFGIGKGVLAAASDLAGTAYKGSFNTAVGTSALGSNTTGYQNAALGHQAMQNNTTGNDNFGLGFQALRYNTTGQYNIAVGSSAGQKNISGGFNIFIGYSSRLNGTAGLRNVMIGSYSGYNNLTGSDNVFIGDKSGFNETGSNQLYIANSNTTKPLIGGTFGAAPANNGVLRFHMGTGAPTNTTGYLAIGDFSLAAPLILKFGNGAVPNNSFRLVVQDGILTEKLKVALKGTAEWADYVFEPSYKKMSLEDVEAYTQKNKHLPNVPSAEEMATNGLDVSQTSKMFMEKIEELTLYVIEMNKEIKALQKENDTLKKSLDKK